MLDTVHTIGKRNFYPLRGFHMCSNFISLLVCLLTDSLHHLRRHLQLTGNAFRLRVQHAAGDHQFDEIHILLL